TRMRRLWIPATGWAESSYRIRHRHCENGQAVYVIAAGRRFSRVSVWNRSRPKKNTRTKDQAAKRHAPARFGSQHNHTMEPKHHLRSGGSGPNLARDP